MKSNGKPNVATLNLTLNKGEIESCLKHINFIVAGGQEIELLNK